MNKLYLKLNESSQWINNTINAYYTEILDIKTLSLFSGTIYANNKCNNFSLECDNKLDIDNTCKNLTLYTTSIINNTYNTYLNCIGYGCQYITIYSLNGLNDISFGATECPCTVDCIDNCIGNWNIYCSNITNINSSNISYNIHSIFQPNNKIDANEECFPDLCCGTIVNQSEPYFVCQSDIFSNVVCKHNVGLDIALIASLAMAGVITFFFIFLGIRQIYRKFKKEEKIKQFEKQKQIDKEKQRQEKKKHRKKIKSQKLKKLAQNPLLKNDNDKIYDVKTPKNVVTTINGK